MAWRIRLVGPGLVAGIATVALSLFIAEHYQGPFLANLAIDSSSSVLSPSGLSRIMEIVGDLGKAAILASVLSLQVGIYLVVWIVRCRRMAAGNADRHRGSIALKQVVVGAAIVALLASAFAVSADSSPLRGAEWGEFLALTLGYALLIVVLANALDLAAFRKSLLARDAGAGPATASPERQQAANGPVRRLTRRAFLTAAGGVAAGSAAVYYMGRSVAHTAATGVQRVLNGIWSPAITPTEDFYVVSKNVFDPRVDAARWSLMVTALSRSPSNCGFLISSSCGSRPASIHSCASAIRSAGN